jgi:hypothetical protein
MKIKLARRTAIALAVTVTAAGLFVASDRGASANDAISEACNTYHSWTECITYDSSTDVLQVSAFNGYVFEEEETVSIQASDDQDEGEVMDIPTYDSSGLGFYTSDPGHACGYIDSQEVVCGTF